jgi:hypothetical protein
MKALPLGKNRRLKGKFSRYRPGANSWASFNNLWRLQNYAE